MAFRQFVEPDCGGINPIMQFGNQIVRDAALKDEGLSRAPAAGPSSRQFQEDALVNEFLGQTAPPPQTFQMDALLQEMRQIEAQDFQRIVAHGPRVIDEVTRSSDWVNEFSENAYASISIENTNYPEFWDQSSNMVHVQPVQEKAVWVEEFSDINEEKNLDEVIPECDKYTITGINPTEFMNFIQNEPGAVGISQGLTSEELAEDWFNEFQTSKIAEAEKTENYNKKFWEKLHDEWQKLSEESENTRPWFNEFTDFYDPYREYNFTQNNPMNEVENALEIGKAFLARGDIPSAVLCFEVAAQKEPNNAEAWEFLGISQAENEMDPQAIAALKKCLDLQPENMKVLMALAVSYTNESLQTQACKMLTTWLHYHPKYKHLVPSNLLQMGTDDTSSLIRAPELKEIQNMFLQAVKENPNEIDPDIQEALGVLFNLSSEYGKAVDCFRAALYVRPNNAKVWNRLGASLANGNRSVEAVQAYKQALRIEPGFIRARYNVGIICMNLKTYKQAAQHLLTALNLQATSSIRSGLKDAPNNHDQMSDTIWSTLRMIISLIGRKDLQNIMVLRDLKALNEAFNDS